MAKNKDIDYLDLSLPLTASQKPAVEQWLAKFKEDFDDILITPKMKGEELRINSSDFIQFMGYVNKSETSEFDFYRLKGTAITQMEQLLTKSVSSAHQYHYKWCLAALKNFEEGRHL